MMPKRFITIMLLFFALYVFLLPRFPVNAQAYALSMTVNCPGKAYVGESFFCQVAIYNNDNASHSYALRWVIDNPFNATPTFKTSGTIGPYETIYTGSSFAFSNAEDPYLSYIMQYNDHQISITLMQDDQAVTTEEFDVKVVKVDISIIPTIQPIPVLPNSSFSLDVKVVNEGDEAINVTLRIYEVRNQIQLQSVAAADYGQISAHTFKNQTFSYTVSPTIVPGEYPIKVVVSYSDTRGDLYSRNYYVSIPVSSSAMAEELGLFESATTNSINKLRSDIDLAYRNIIIITGALLLVSAGLATANYWYSRRIARIRRKLAAEKPRQN